MNRLEFLRVFMGDKNVASITPSSMFAVRKICKSIDFDKKAVIVEYGAGNGAFTEYILKKMHHDSKLIAIEKNEEFVSILKKIKDPRFFVFLNSAENIEQILKQCGETKADYVLSGIPFSFFDAQLGDKIVRNTKSMLSWEGRFIVYQFSNKVEKYLNQHFTDVTPDWTMLNIPPLRVYNLLK